MFARIFCKKCKSQNKRNFFLLLRLVNYTHTSSFSYLSVEFGGLRFSWIQKRGHRVGRVGRAAGGSKLYRK